MKIYYADINKFSDSFYRNALDIVPFEKRKELKAIKFDERKKESLLGWILCVTALKEYDINNVHIAFTEKGKPYLTDKGIYFNISHSNGFVCCAVSKSNVGIDIEANRKIGDGVRRYVLCENELNLFINGNSTDDDFIKLWTLKESYLKHSGEGIAGGLKELDFSPFFDKTEFNYLSLHFMTCKLGGMHFSACSDDSSYEFILFSPNI